MNNLSPLLAAGGLVLGLALSAIGTLLLGAARAIAKHGPSERRRRADIGQYAAALGALAGFLLAAAGGAMLTAALLPFDGPVRLVVAAVTGVLVFAAAGVGFSRVADASEEARARRMPPPRYTPSVHPNTPPVSGPNAARPLAHAVPSPATAPPISGPPSPPAPGAPAGAPYRAPAAEDSVQAEETAQAAADGMVDGNAAGEGTTTPDGAPTSQDAAPQDAPASANESTSANAPASEDAPVSEDAPTADGASIADAHALVRVVRPGWIYRDHSDHWYLGVGDAQSTAPLLRLPEFTLAGAEDPTYPLLVAGAGEIAVVPLPAMSDEAESSV